MERLDRAFVVLAALAFVMYLIWLTKPKHKPDMPRTNVMLSPPCEGNPVGPAYLTSNLPLHREGDDTMPSVSVGRDQATATGATAV